MESWSFVSQPGMRTLFPGARLGPCLRHALNKLPGKLTAIASPVRKALRSQFHTLWYRVRQRKSVRVFALGQRLRRFADHVTHKAGVANRERVRRWLQEKKAGWYAVLADPQMPATSTLLAVVFEKWRWQFLYRTSKGIAFDKQADNDVVHLGRFRKADGLADQAFNTCP